MGNCSWCWVTTSYHIFVNCVNEPYPAKSDMSYEASEGDHFGRKISIYVSFIEELSLHRHHYYRVTIKEVRKHHIRVMPDFEEIESE